MRSLPGQGTASQGSGISASACLDLATGRAWLVGARFRSRGRSILGYRIGWNAPPTMQHGGSPHRHCRNAARCQAAGSTAYSPWPALPVGRRLCSSCTFRSSWPGRCLAASSCLRSCWLSVTPCASSATSSGCWPCLLMGWVRCGVKPDLSARDVIPTPRRPTGTEGHPRPLKTRKPRKHDVSRARAFDSMVERKGIEPSTFAMRTRRSPS